MQKKAVLKSLRSVRAVQENGPAKPENIVQNGFQTRFVIMVRKNSLWVIKYGGDPRF
jgi:hypothetical protein